MTVAVVILAGVMVAWLLELPLGRRIRRLADASTLLGQGELGARVPEEGPTELRVLAESFNQMAADLEGSIDAQREFVANASHQLRTPLTGLRLRLEAIKGEGGLGGEQAAKAEVELDRLAALVDDMLALARANAPPAAADPIDLETLAREAVGRRRQAAVAASKHLELRAGGAPRCGRTGKTSPMCSTTCSTMRSGTPRPEPRCGSRPTSTATAPSSCLGLWPWHAARGPTARIRALLPRCERPAGRSRHGPRSSHRRRARATLGARSGSARGQARVWRWSFYGCLPNLDQALAESWHEGW